VPIRGLSLSQKTFFVWSRRPSRLQPVVYTNLYFVVSGRVELLAFFVRVRGLAAHTNEKPVAFSKISFDVAEKLQHQMKKVVFPRCRRRKRPLRLEQILRPHKSRK
jgi:hypothetical protein